MGKVKANMIMELMGRPPKHIKEALNTVVVRLGSEKGVNVIDKTYHKPKSVKETKSLYTTFAEINAEFDSIEHFFAIIMGYMPSNVEVYEPEKFKLSVHEINSLGNYLMSKMHKFDELAKRAIVERNIVLKRLQGLGDNMALEDMIKAKVSEKEDSKKKEKIGKSKKE